MKPVIHTLWVLTCCGMLAALVYVAAKPLRETPLDHKTIGMDSPKPGLFVPPPPLVNDANETLAWIRDTGLVQIHVQPKRVCEMRCFLKAAKWSWHEQQTAYEAGTNLPHAGEVDFVYTVMLSAKPFTAADLECLESLSTEVVLFVGFSADEPVEVPATPIRG